MPNWTRCRVLALFLIAPWLLCACSRHSAEFPAVALIQSKDGDVARFVDASDRRGSRLMMNDRVAWDGDRAIGVRSPLSGRVERIFVQLGDRVRKGQPLAELDARHGVTSRSGDRYVMLRSPADGVIIQRSIRLGQKLHGGGLEEPQFVIADPSRLWVVLDTGGGDRGDLQPMGASEFRIGS